MKKPSDDRSSEGETLETAFAVSRQGLTYYVRAEWWKQSHSRFSVSGAQGFTGEAFHLVGDFAWISLWIKGASRAEFHCCMVSNIARIRRKAFTFAEPYNPFRLFRPFTALVHHSTQ
jgi:hypothetical protein